MGQEQSSCDTTQIDPRSTVDPLVFLRIVTRDPGITGRVPVGSYLDRSPFRPPSKVHSPNTPALHSHHSQLSGARAYVRLLLFLIGFAYGKNYRGWERDCQGAESRKRPYLRAQKRHPSVETNTAKLSEWIFDRIRSIALRFFLQHKKTKSLSPYDKRLSVYCRLINSFGTALFFSAPEPWRRRSDRVLPSSGYRQKPQPPGI